nr:ABC transporter ATP-binding protein [Lacticaseibacillus suibinensis]
MLKVQHLNFAFGHQVILNDLSFTLPDGSITGLVAPNGTGKTTLLVWSVAKWPEGDDAERHRPVPKAQGVFGAVVLPREF